MKKTNIICRFQNDSPGVDETIRDIADRFQRSRKKQKRIKSKGENFNNDAGYIGDERNMDE